MPTLDEIRTVLYDHFPEWLTGMCLCGTAVPTYREWLDHVLAEMEADNDIQ
jgi:hypothetical protein